MFSHSWFSKFFLIATLALITRDVALGQSNIPPTVTITSPASGTTFASPASITIAVTAADADGSVEKVEYFANNSLLGVTTTSPHEFKWINVAAEIYSVEAIVTDNQGASIASSAVTLNVVPPDSPSIVGEWSSLIQFPNPSRCAGCQFLPIHVSLLPNRKVLMWQDDNPSGKRGPAAFTVAYVWDVGSNTFTPVHNETTDIFCSGHAFLPDGTLLVAGGHNQSNNNGATTTNLFNFETNTWTLSPHHMSEGRWYPTVNTLPNGDMLVVAGNRTSATGANTIPEVWQTATGGGWRQLTTAVLAQPVYPWMHVAPNGKVFNSGPSRITRYLDTTGAGSWTAAGRHIFVGARNNGSSVMYDDGKVLVMGGGVPPTNTAETIDLNAATPQWQSAGPMAFARRQINATVLPNGRVLVTGGSSSPGVNDATLAVLAAETWDPVARSFSTMASMQVPRMYHSVALLLPDGRVLVAGGGRPAATGTTNQPNAQIYSPPYLFAPSGGAAIRPSISSAPASVVYGQQFVISTPDAAEITEVALIPIGSVTHSVNRTQRFTRLGFTLSSGILTAVAPANGNVAPPGYYMMFILKNGVPSVAHILNVNI